MSRMHVCIKDDREDRDPIWVNGEGNEYWCGCQIEDGHLINIIRLLERVWVPFPMLQGEMAQYYAEMEYDGIVESLGDTLAVLRDIAEERGLSVGA